jgi:hypothetical protein
MSLSLYDLQLINESDTHYASLLKIEYELEQKYRKLSWAKWRVQGNDKLHCDIIKEIDIIKNNWKEVQIFAYEESTSCSIFFEKQYRIYKYIKIES